MFEKVNMYHPDKVMDRIAGAIVDLGYKKNENLIIAGEGMLGHNQCNIIIESNTDFTKNEVEKIVNRIVEDNNIKVYLKVVPQDKNLALNQKYEIKCGDNGIFKGIPLTEEEKILSEVAKEICEEFKSDGKYIYNSEDNTLIICQSKCDKDIELKKRYLKQGFENVIINPLGYWDGGINTDCGCVNRKLGSDMAQSVTGGGLHFKCLSKADVSVNVYCFCEAQRLNKIVEGYCAIGDKDVTIYIYEKNGAKTKKIVPYKEIVEYTKKYINKIGGFEKFAEWGLA